MSSNRNINGLTFDKAKIGALEDSSLYWELSNTKHFVGTWGNRLASRASGLNVYINTGIAFIYGRATRIEQETMISVPPNKKGVIVLEIDLRKTNDWSGDPATDTYTWDIKQVDLKHKETATMEDLTRNGKIFDFILYEYTSTNSSVTLVDKRQLSTPWGEYNDKLTAMDTKVNDFDSRIRTNTTNISILRSDLNTTTKRSTDNETRIGLLERGETGVGLVVKSLESRMGKAETDISGLNRRVGNLESRIYVIHSGTQAPNNNLGNNGDLYIRVK